MPYLVLEAKKKGTRFGREFSFAPNGWIDQVNAIVYWPRSGLLSKRQYEEYSAFESDWIPQPIIKIRHKDLSFQEADELTEHYINKASETETDDSEWEKTALSRTERAKKRLVPQLASLPRTTQYSLAITSSLSGKTLENENLPTNMDNEINEIISEVNPEIIADTDSKYQSYSVVKGADGTTVFIAPENFSSPNEQIFQVENIQDVQTTNTIQSPPHHCVSSQQFGALYASVQEMSNDIEELKASVKGLGDVLTHILTQTSNVDRYITDYLKKTNECNDREVISAQPIEEDFSDLESKPKFKSTQDLEEFERLLEDKTYQVRFIRFLKTKFRMNSHENGQTFFMMVIRLLTEPSLFLPYSWKGLHRKDSHNLSFEGKHKIFTAFMFRIVRIADHTKVQTDVDKMFENLLRFKKVNNSREVLRTKPSKKPSSRSRPKGLKYKAESEAVSNDEAE